LPRLARAAGIAALLAACLAAPGCAGKGDEAAEPEPIAPVQVEAVRQDSIRRIIQADAVLFPRDQAAIVPKISAPVARFFVNRGDHVKQGQLVATLENRDLAAAVAEGKAELAQTEANYRSISGATIPEELTKAETDVQADTQQFAAAQKLLESRQRLFKEGALARKQVDEAEVQYAQARSQLEAAQQHLKAVKSVGRESQIQTAAAQRASARARLQAAQAQLGYTSIQSPIAGIVSDRPLYPGEIAGAGSALLTVVDISSVVARANLPQNQAAYVRVDDSATVKTDSGLEIPGKVTVVSPATDPATTTVQVWVHVSNPGEKLKPGASARVAIVAATIPDAVVVPPSAILPGPDGGTVVAVVGRDSLAHMKRVEIGLREPDKAQILSGVAPGERVIVAGGVGLGDNAKVRIMKAGEKPEGEPTASSKGKDEAK
jgi:multidrug efflux pump subunit AcrA (membrane-fusion protein)